MLSAFEVRPPHRPEGQANRPAVAGPRRPPRGRPSRLPHLPQERRVLTLELATAWRYAQDTPRVSLLRGAPLQAPGSACPRARIHSTGAQLARGVEAGRVVYIQTRPLRAKLPRQTRSRVRMPALGPTQDSLPPAPLGQPSTPFGLNRARARAVRGLRGPIAPPGPPLPTRAPATRTGDSMVPQGAPQLHHC